MFGGGGWYGDFKHWSLFSSEFSLHNKDEIFLFLPQHPLRRREQHNGCQDWRQSQRKVRKDFNQKISLNLHIFSFCETNLPNVVTDQYLWVFLNGAIQSSDIDCSIRCDSDDHWNIYLKYYLNLNISYNIHSCLFLSFSWYILKKHLAESKLKIFN